MGIVFSVFRKKKESLGREGVPRLFGKQEPIKLGPFRLWNSPPNGGVVDGLAQMSYTHLN